MPLPRFRRLPADEQRRIIDAARRVFAKEGVDRASYNQVIAAAGISKSAAYNYFDGREDLLSTVLDDVAARLAAVLGEWEPVAEEDAFWAAVDAADSRIEKHIAEHPDDLALVDPAFLLRAEGLYMAWIGGLVDNGTAIGLITVGCDRDLLIAATAAVLRVGDDWMATRLRAGFAADSEQPLRLIRSMWGASRADRTDTDGTGR